jgi:hypothetical protein
MQGGGVDEETSNERFAGGGGRSQQASCMAYDQASAAGRADAGITKLITRPEAPTGICRLSGSSAVTRNKSVSDHASLSFSLRATKVQWLGTTLAVKAEAVAHVLVG